MYPIGKICVRRVTFGCALQGLAQLTDFLLTPKFQTSIIAPLHQHWLGLGLLLSARLPALLTVTREDIMKLQFFVILLVAVLGLNGADKALAALQDAPAQKKEEQKKDDAKEPDAV